MSVTIIPFHALLEVLECTEKAYYLFPNNVKGHYSVVDLMSSYSKRMIINEINGMICDFYGEENIEDILNKFEIKIILKNGVVCNDITFLISSHKNTEDKDIFDDYCSEGKIIPINNDKIYYVMKEPIIMKSNNFFTMSISFNDKIYGLLCKKLIQSFIK